MRYIYRKITIWYRVQLQEIDYTIQETIIDHIDLHYSSEAQLYPGKCIVQQDNIWLKLSPINMQLTNIHSMNIAQCISSNKRRQNQLKWKIE